MQKKYLLVPLLLMLVLGSKSFAIELKKDFLQSTIEGTGMTVEDLVDVVKNVKLSNGKHPKINGWSKNDNVYTLKTTMMSPVKFEFTHMLNYEGKISILSVYVDNQPANAQRTLMQLISMPRDHSLIDTKKEESAKRMAEQENESAEKEEQLRQKQIEESNAVKE
jgi:hypothetical protein